VIQEVWHRSEIWRLAASLLPLAAAKAELLLLVPTGRGDRRGSDGQCSEHGQPAWMLQQGFTASVGSQRGCSERGQPAWMLRRLARVRGAREGNRERKIECGESGGPLDGFTKSKIFVAHLVCRCATELENYVAHPTSRCATELISFF
jgi:hypothetical protein